MTVIAVDHYHPYAFPFRSFTIVHLEVCASTSVGWNGAGHAVWVVTMA